MAPPMSLLPLLFLIFSSSCIPPASSSPLALVSPVTLDPSTSQYFLSLQQRTPPTKELLVLDISNSILWENCLPRYQSSSFQPVLCHSAVCNSASVCNSAICAGPGCLTCFDKPSPVCFNNSCGTSITNTAISTSTGAQLWTDTIILDSTDGNNPGSAVKIPKFAFACGDDLLLRNHSVPVGVNGVAGLSRARLALPTQLASKKSLKRKFAYCLPSSGGPGVVFFGDSPYVFLGGPSIDVSKLLRFTPLLRDTTQPDEYFIGVNSISVNDVKLAIDSKLLKIRNDGTGSTEGGTRLSSVLRYTQLKPAIYKVLRDAFTKAAVARGIRKVAPVKPFDTCFNASTAFSTRVGYNVPAIDLALQGSGGVVWSIVGANSVVSVNDKVFCLAFQETGEFEPRSIVIGTFQQQDALLQFDLATSRLGFLSTLLGFRTTCSNFNFTRSS